PRRSSYQRSYVVTEVPRPHDPRAVHSFPTRRSSDLRPPQGCRRGADPHPDRDRHLDHRPLGPGGGTREQLQRAAPPAWWQGHREDRKSTRLNSSHVKISYAVVCLKKKKGN